VKRTRKGGAGGPLGRKKGKRRLDGTNKKAQRTFGKEVTGRRVYKRKQKKYQKSERRKRGTKE